MVLNFLIFNFNFNFWWLVNVIVVVNLTSICKPCIASDSCIAHRKNKARSYLVSGVKQGQCIAMFC